MPDFSKRSNEIEIMDDLSCQGEIVNQTLRELETINELLGGNYVTIDGLEKLIGQQTKTFRIADLGCGSGDILRLIKKWALKKNLAVELIGFDANPFIVTYAIDHTPEHYGIKFRALDIFSEEFRAEKFDVVIGTLFFHHFTNDQLSFFFKQLRSQVSVGIIVNDIHRHWFAYNSIKWLTRLFSKSKMVQNDGPLSVLRAFSKKELMEVMNNAGIKNFKIRWMWAFRWQVIAFVD